MHHISTMTTGFVLSGLIAVWVLFAHRPVTREDLPGDPVHWRIDLNQAPPGTLSLLPGVGPRLADRIARRRALIGSYARIDELMEIRGIGHKVFTRVRPWVTCESIHQSPRWIGHETSVVGDIVHTGSPGSGIQD